MLAALPVLFLAVPVILYPFLGRNSLDGNAGFAGWKSALKYRALKWMGGSTEPWNGVIVGTGDWLYYNEELERDFPMEESRSFARNIRLLQEYLEARNSRFLFFITPDKHRIYPEFLPAGCGKRYPSMDQDLAPLLAALKEEGVAFLDLYEVFREAKRSHPADWTLYAPGGTHWTPFGTSLVASEIFRRMGREWNRPPVPVTFGWNDNDDLTAMLHLLGQFRFRKQVPHVENANSLRSRPEDPPGRKEWLFVGDSFLRVAAFSYLMNLPSREFSTVREALQEEHSLRYVYGLAPSIGFLSREGYDRVVFGFVERVLGVYAERFRDLTLLPEFEAIFHLADTVFSMAAADPGRIGVHDAEAIREGMFLSARITGANPAFGFPEFKEGWADAYHKWLRLDVLSGEDGEIGIRFRTPEGTRSDFSPIPEGASIRHFRLPAYARDLEILPAKSPARPGRSVIVRSLVIAK